MRRVGAVGAVVAAVLAGVIVGAVAMAGIQDAGSAPGPPAPAPVVGAEEPHTPRPGGDGPAVTRPAGERAQDAPGPAPAVGPAVLLAWTAQGLDPGLVAAATGDPQVSATSVVRGGTVDLAASRRAGGAAVDAPDEGWTIPLDAIAVDPEAHARFASGGDRAAVAGLQSGQALLGTTSAELRRLGPGDTIELAGGPTVTVGGVVADTAIGGAELAVDTATGERAGLTTDRYALLAYEGERSALEQRLAATPGRAVRFRGPGEAPFLRNGDAVLPQALIKHRFGEFAYRRGPGDEFAQDPAWQAANLVEVDLPIIGRARCHQAVVAALAGALGEVVDANLAALVDPEGFAGCWNARTVRAGSAVSRHAWGVAVDLNFGANPTGLASVQDPRLVAIFGRWGFTEGSGWLVPDAGHFEFVSPPHR